jgi:peptide/nickel transport system substrate-binding protein
MLTRRSVLTATAAAALLPQAASAEAESVLRVAMTLGDIPLTTGQPSQGGEGQRFIGYTLYDALINWDLSRADVAAPLSPGLAESWEVDEATHTVWTFKLRPGVKFHDGSLFDADAVVWNLEKLMNRSAPHYDQAQATQAGTYIGTIASYRVIAPLTVEVTTKAPDAVFPYQVVNIYMSSPARWKELGDWTKVARSPSGTGPWSLEKLVPRDRAELRRNATYWNPKRIPKSDRMILRAIPDASTRLAALMSGEVDWVEAPPPDAVPQLKAAGMQVVTNVYPHIWPYQLSFAPDSPMRDLRLRKAANLAIDRDGLVNLLGGLALPAKGMVTPKHPWFGKPSFDIKYDPDAARALLKEAGFGPSNPVKLKFLISTAGSGQMQPLQMNEFIQDNMKEVGFDVAFDTMDWESLRARRRGGVELPENKGAHGLNNSWSFTDPDIGLIAASWSKMRPPGGYNWGGFSDPETDAIAAKAKVEFDPAKQNELLARLHARIVDQAMWIWVVHDLNPRALGAKVTGYVEAQSWFQDLTPVHVV